MSGALVGGPFFSWLADIVGVLNINIIVIIFLAGFQFSLLGARSPAAVVIIAFLYGFLSNAFQGTIGALFARLSFSVAEMGHRMGFGYFVLGVGALIGMMTPLTLLLNGVFLAEILFACQVHPSRARCWGVRMCGGGRRYLSL